MCTCGARTGSLKFPSCALQLFFPRGQRIQYVFCFQKKTGLKSSDAHARRSPQSKLTIFKRVNYWLFITSHVNNVLLSSRDLGFDRSSM